MLTVIHTTILCLQCDLRISRLWLADMICVHITGIWQFLRIGAGLDEVKAALCTVCPSCAEHSSSANGEDGMDLVSKTSQEEIHILKEVEKENHLVVGCTFGEAERYLEKGRPLIRVGRRRISTILY